MRSLPRRVLFALAPLAVLLVVLSAATSLWLAMWIPTHGKAFVEERASRALGLEVRLDSLRYAFGQGVLIDQLRATDPATSTMWIDAPQVRVRLQPLWLLRHRAVFQVDSQLTAPCPTQLVMAGRYDLRTHALTLDVDTSPAAIESIMPALAARLPPELQGGTIRVTLHITHQPPMETVITGQVIGTQVVWRRDRLRVQGDVVLDGRYVRTPQDRRPASLNAKVVLTRGDAQGLPLLEQAQQLSGTLRLTDEHLTIERLEGVSLETPWVVEGNVRLAPALDADLLLRATVNMETMAQRWEALRAWQPHGSAQVRIVYRGTFKDWPAAELMATAHVDGASLTMPRGPYRFEQLTGRLQYDHLSHQLVMEQVTATVQGAPVTAHGTLVLTTPASLTAHAETDADLSLLQALVPPQHPVHSLSGPAHLTLELDGPFSAPQWRATGALSNATVKLRDLPAPLEHISGTVQVTNTTASATHLTLVIAGEPIDLTATLTDLSGTPHLVTEARVGRGSLTLASTWLPQTMEVETADVILGASTLHVQGSISRAAGTPSRLLATGRIHLLDLAHLPWKPLPWVETWQLDGDTNVQVEVQGPLTDWPRTAARGTLRAEALSVRDIPLQNVHVELEHARGQLTVHLTRAVMAGGPLAGECVIAYEPPQAQFRAVVDVTRADLAQLALAIPAWRNRGIQGDASLHAVLTGRWTDRASLQGDGWVHATGEHLAELPLLDRLLQGVFGTLADRLGLSMLRTAQITTLSSQWQLTNERLMTDDLKLGGFSGAEPVALYVRGSVGWDNTLDLTVEPELSEQLILHAPRTSAISGTILQALGGLERLRRLVGRHHLGGTTDKPEYKFEFSLDQLFNQTLPTAIEQLFSPSQ